MMLQSLGVSVNLRRSGVRMAVLATLTVSAGCAAAVIELPEPRTIVIHSGARLRADQARMQEVNEWVTRETNNIIEDPTFFIDHQETAREVYVWEQLYVAVSPGDAQDSASIAIDPRAFDTIALHHIYAHLHLMAEVGRRDEWLPEALDAVEYELERAILKRVSDAWLMGRTVFDFPPYGPLDELTYANEAGFLDAFTFTARPSEFAVARAEWARENPGETDRYRDWFVETFSREPPGLRSR